MRTHKELLVWQKSMLLVESVYRLVKLLPREEIYALFDQMRRAAVSIPSNIAEGNARNSSKEFQRFLYIALGSAAELETQLLICQRLGYISQKEIDAVTNQCSEVTKMLRSLLRVVATSGNGTSS